MALRSQAGVSRAAALPRRHASSRGGGATRAHTRHTRALTRHCAAGGALLAAQEHNAGGGVAVQQRVHALAAVAQHVVVDVAAERGGVGWGWGWVGVQERQRKRQAGRDAQRSRRRTHALLVRAKAPLPVPAPANGAPCRRSMMPGPPSRRGACRPPLHPPSSPAQHRLKRLGQEAALDDQPLRAVQRAAGAQLREQELLRGGRRGGPQAGAR